MQYIRFTGKRGDAAAVGLLVGADVHPLPFAAMSELMRCPLRVLRAITTSALAAPPVSAAGLTLLPPLDGRTLVWAAGVTYRRSLDARVEESAVPDVYDRVYASDRPELFLKAVPWKVVTTGQSIAIRSDSELDVPEPELAAVVNSAGEIIGYTVCNDVSSRSLEGDNPLYLPQAKIYDASCALAPGIVPAWEIPDAHALVIACRVERQGVDVWSGSVGTDQLARGLHDLVAYLWRDQTFEDGVILSTGTGLVPELSFSLREGDIVHVDIAGVGSLTNPVTRGITR